MHDVFIVHHYQDQSFAAGLADDLAGRGLTLGHAVTLWPPGTRLLPAVDQGLCEARHAVVVVSAEFLKITWPRKELDGLTTRRRVVSLLHGVTERDVGGHSVRLAVAALPGSMAENLVRLLRSAGGPSGTGQANGHGPAR